MCSKMVHTSHTRETSVTLSWPLWLSLVKIKVISVSYSCALPYHTAGYFLGGSSMFKTAQNLIISLVKSHSLIIHSHFPSLMNTNAVRITPLPWLFFFKLIIEILLWLSLKESKKKREKARMWIAVSNLYTSVYTEWGIIYVHATYWHTRGE